MADVFRQVVTDLADREFLGAHRYGKPKLDEADNRDWLQEAYEECLDMAVYLKAELLRRNGR